MTRTPHVLMLFLDGVGIGRKNARYNPFFATNLRAFQSLLGETMPHLRDAHRVSASASLVPINATLGVAGLPQSGTGQTSLLTGINAARRIGKHYGPYPYSALRTVIKERNIFHQLHMKGKMVFYANAFPQQFFDHIKTSANHVTAITMSWIMSGFPLNDHSALAAGKALSSDITSERWNKLGFPRVPVSTPQEAGRRLIGFTQQYDFVLYEYYLTDHAGHSQSMEEAKEILHNLDGLLEGILCSINADSTLFVVTSDHGNMEDLSTKSHSRNPVPLLCVGHKHRQFAQSVKNITHVTPAIVNMMQ